MLIKIGYAFAIALTLAFGVLHAKASEIETGAGIVCDEAAQVVRYIQLYDNAQAAADQVNMEFNSPVACVPATVAFIRGSPIEKEKTWIITAILVVAVATLQGWARIEPHVYFLAFKETTVEERGA